MKEATNAPLFACMYSGLAEAARANGYALSIHGSVVTDLDLVAIPWTDTAIPEEELIRKLTEAIDASDHRGLLKRECGSYMTDAQIDGVVKTRNGNQDLPNGSTMKPHGRRAWNLYMAFGVKVDISVMPPLNHCKILSREDANLIVGALDSLGVALTGQDHQWSDGERAIYESAIAMLRFGMD